MDDRFSNFLSASFHESNFNIYSTALELHFDLLKDDEIILVNANEFPNIYIQILTIKEASIYINEDAFFEFMSLAVACSKLLVYVGQGIRPMYYCPDAVKAAGNFHKSMETVTPYIKAYEGGLLKSAYLRAKDDEVHVVFSIINSEAKLISLDEAESIVEEYDDVDVWLDYVCSKAVSVLYINNDEDLFWYEVLHEDYEAELFKKWGWS